MRGKPEIIERLNTLLFNELTAINQYFLHARILKQWGFRELGELIYAESLGEMRHADRLIERILFLDGLPNLQTLGKLHIGETVPEALKADLTLESTSRTDVVGAIAFFESEQDFVSRELATNILVDSEKHIDYLETQLGLITRMGEHNYLQSAAGDPKESS
jgi:bacterioferritin